MKRLTVAIVVLGACAVIRTAAVQLSSADAEVQYQLGRDLKLHVRIVDRQLIRGAPHDCARRHRRDRHNDPFHDFSSRSWLCSMSIDTR